MVYDRSWRLFCQVQYAVFADKYYPSIVLKEWNYWGGCRAGGSKDYTISFKEPEGVLYKVKRTILMKGDLVEF